MTVGTGRVLVHFIKHQTHLCMTERGNLPVGMTVNAMRGLIPIGFMAGRAGRMVFLESLGLQSGVFGLMATAATFFVMAIHTLETKTLNVFLVPENDLLPVLRAQRGD